MKPALLTLLLALSACATTGTPEAPRDVFFERLMALCGRSFEGRIVSPPVAADAAFAGQRLVIHLRDCSPQVMRIPFQVGQDRSRTWVIGRGGDGLTLRHVHRHADGGEDELSQYGGATVDPGSARRQSFPADSGTRALFVRRGIPASAANIWSVEVDPGRTLAYELARPGRIFRVEFDLRNPVAKPPPAWGED